MIKESQHDSTRLKHFIQITDYGLYTYNVLLDVRNNNIYNKTLLNTERLYLTS